MNTKLFESYNENLKEEENSNIYCGTFEEFQKEVEVYGGLYGFVSEKYYSMPINLLKEIALNAIYELNNDSKVIQDIKERLYDNEEELKEDDEKRFVGDLPNEFLKRDWEKLQKDPMVNAKEHWSDVYYSEVLEYGKSLKRK